MKRLFFIPLLFILGSCAHNEPHRQPQASFMESCKSMVSKLLLKEQKKFLSESQEQSLQKALNKWYKPQYTRLMNSNDDYFAHLFFQAPEEIRQIYYQAPFERSAVREFFDEIISLVNLEKRENHILKSFNDTFLKRVFVEKRGISVSEYASNLLERYKHISLARKDELTSEISNFWKYQRAIRYYENNFYVNLETIKKNRKTFVKLRGQLIQYQMKNGNYHLKVPRDFVRIRGDNPLDTKKLVRMSQAIGLSAPRVYNGYLGLHGRFFLADGNHRFTARETREFVWINIGPKLQTLNLELHIVNSGGLRPKRDVLLKLYNGELDVFEIMPEVLKNDFPFDRSELISKPVSDN